MSDLYHFCACYAVSVTLSVLFARCSRVRRVCCCAPGGRRHRSIAARSNSRGVAICYVLRVIWMTSYSHIMDRICEGDHSVAGSDVIASSCAGYSAAGASYWLRCVYSLTAGAETKPFPGARGATGRRRSVKCIKSGFVLTCSSTQNVQF